MLFIHLTEQRSKTELVSLQFRCLRGAIPSAGTGPVTPSLPRVPLTGGGAVSPVSLFLVCVTSSHCPCRTWGQGCRALHTANELTKAPEEPLLFSSARRDFPAFGLSDSTHGFSGNHNTFIMIYTVIFVLTSSTSYAICSEGCQ